MITIINYLKHRKNTEKADPKVSKIKNGKAMLSPTCDVWGSTEKADRKVSKIKNRKTMLSLNFTHNKLRFRYWVEHCFNCVDAFNNSFS